MAPSSAAAGLSDIDRAGASYEAEAVKRNAKVASVKISLIASARPPNLVTEGGSLPTPFRPVLRSCYVPELTEEDEIVWNKVTADRAQSYHEANQVRMPSRVLSAGSLAFCL